jgi:hypothetical protein
MHVNIRDIDVITAQVYPVNGPLPIRVWTSIITAGNRVIISTGVMVSNF